MPHQRSRQSLRCIRLSRKLAAYAGALTAVAGSAEAAIIYTDLGPDGVRVVNNGFDVDLDGGGVVDFNLGFDEIFTSHSTSYGNRIHRRIQRSLIQGAAGNAVLTGGLGSVWVLPVGSQIGTADAAGRTMGVLGTCSSGGSSTSGGEWLDSWADCLGTVFKTCSDESASLCMGQFVGVAFEIGDGSRRAGWLELEANTRAIRLFGYAYETVPGKSILAGDKGSPPNLPGDTNGDFRVDIIDLNNVRNDFGATGDGVLGDTDGDDVVDIEDLNAVRNNFGAGNPVPEPPSLVLLAAGAAGLAMLRPKRAISEKK